VSRPRLLGFLLLAAALALTAAAPPPSATAAGASAASPAVTQFAGQLDVGRGQVYRGSVNMVAGSVRVDGTLDGNVTLTAGQLAVGPSGSVLGSVQIGAGQVQLAPGGRIVGTVQVGDHTLPGMTCVLALPALPGSCTLSGAGHASSVTVRRSVPLRLPGILAALRGGLHHWSPWGYGGPGIVRRILGWIGMLALALPVAAIWPGPLQAVQREIEGRAGTSALAGLAALVLALPVLLIVSITIIGIPVALAAALGLVAAWFFGYVAVAALVGTRTASLVRSGAPSLAPLWALVLGTALLAALAWIPILGGLASLAVACVGLGAVLLSRFGSGRPWLPGRGGAPDPRLGP
jgi:hypothetical protein